MPINNAMARIRTIKPEFFVSSQIAECSARARLLFIGLWVFSDDGGRHPADCAQLKMEVFPGDTIDVAEVVTMVAELVKAGLISSYLVDSKRFWQVTGWHHQRIDRPTFRYPGPNGKTPDSASPLRVFEDTSATESSRVESKGVESSRKESSLKESTSSRVESTRANEPTRLDTDERRSLEEVSWEEVWRIANIYGGKITRSKRNWEVTPKFKERIQKAAVVVAAGLASESWLANAVELLLESNRRNPTNYLGRVLATSFAKWDACQRAITIPKRETSDDD